MDGWSGLRARIRSWARGLMRRSRVEADMAEEFGHHIELRAADLERTGLSRKEATRRAHLEFGHMESHREAARASRGLGRIDQIRFSWIDVKLGLRMLVKHPGLTIVAVFALGVGIPVGLAPMHVSNAIEAPLPEDPEDRVRSIRYWDPVSTGVVSPTYYELDLWRREVTSFEALGANRSSTYNLDPGDGRITPVIGAEVTASSFGILGTPPLMGRALDPGDELRESAAVVVLGQDLWEARFGGDPDIVGRTVRISQDSHTVVGVMPSGFLFPANAQLWLPLREEQVLTPGEGHGLRIFGRLTDGATSQEAEAELRSLGPTSGIDTPESMARLRAEVVPFGLGFIDLPRDGFSGMPEFYLFQALALAVLLVASVNVAMLIFARTATRFRELAVRTALGAGRARIVTQIFAETLVLALIAAGAGLMVVDWLLGRFEWGVIISENVIPYWFQLGVTREAVLGGLALAALSATVAGVVPAVRITGRKIQQNIRRAHAGRSGIRFGGLTSGLIVADVAITVAVVGIAFGLSEQLRATTTRVNLVGIPADEFLAVEVRMPLTEGQSGPAYNRPEWKERLAATQETLVERLLAEPGVKSVAVADALPRMDHRSRRVQLEPAGDFPSGWVRTVRADVEFFDALGQRVLAGRGFTRADVEPATPAAIVNTVFVDRVLGGRDPIGRRLHFIASGGLEGSPSYEIVGVVGHLGMDLVDPQGSVGVYVATAPGDIYPLQLGIHLGGTPQDFAPRIRNLVAEVDPAAVVLADPVVLSDVYQGDWYLMIWTVTGLGLLVLILVALAASGIYALMSFSVSERTREIGIRTALGAGKRALILTIARRSLAQIIAGALLGMPLAAWVYRQFERLPGEESTPSVALVALALGAGVAMVVGLFSCLVPVRRALGIQASEALRAE